MNIDQVIYFLSVAETGSINASAKNFFISQQAINLQLTNLENELNTKLFSRKNKGFTLTKQGEMFQKHAQKIVDEYRSVLAELKALDNYQKLQQSVHGTISIFAASIFADTLLPEIIREFTKIYPNTIIRVFEANPEELPHFLQKQYCDIALLSSHVYYANNILSNTEKHDIRLVPLLEDHISLCVRKDDPIAQHKSIDTAMLSNKIPNKKYSFYQIVPYTGANVKYNDSISNSMNIELHKNLILSGIVGTFMPTLAFHYKFHDENLTCIDVTDSEALMHCLLYHDDPNNENYILLQTFVIYLYDYFLSRFGPKIIGKRPKDILLK